MAAGVRRNTPKIRAGMRVGEPSEPPEPEAISSLWQRSVIAFGMLWLTATVLARTVDTRGCHGYLDAR